MTVFPVIFRAARVLTQLASLRPSFVRELITGDGCFTISFTPWIKKTTSLHIDTDGNSTGLDEFIQHIEELEALRDRIINRENIYNV